MDAPTTDPLANHYKYITLSNISSGSYGFVIKAHNKLDNETVRLSAFTAHLGPLRPAKTACCFHSERHNSSQPKFEDGGTPLPPAVQLLLCAALCLVFRECLYVWVDSA